MHGAVLIVFSELNKEVILDKGGFNVLVTHVSKQNLSLKWLKVKKSKPKGNQSQSIRLSQIRQLLKLQPIK